MTQIKRKNPYNEDRLYRIYHHIKDRCGNPRNDAYKNYGGRGICLSKAWSTFPAFKAWALKHGYRDGLTLERIDNDKGYSPENCRWATDEEQSNNRRSNSFVTYKGKKQTYRQWEKELGLTRGLIAVRKFRGHSPIETIKKYDGGE